MNYAIIRNAKYQANKLSLVFRHNERKNSYYSNKDINRKVSNVNYSIKKCVVPYSKKLNELKREYNLRGTFKGN